MKRILLILLILITALSAETVYTGVHSETGARVIQATKNSVIVEFTTGDIITERSSNGDVYFAMPNVAKRYDDIGKPELPELLKRVQVDITGKVSVTVLEERSEVLGTFDVSPLQPHATHNETTFPYTKDMSVYQQNAFYPASPVSLHNVAILRDIRVANVHYAPVQYNPVTREARVVRSLKVRIETSATEAGQSEFKRKYRGLTRSFMPFYKDVLNFNTAHLTEKSKMGCYLFIGSKATLEAVADLAAWKAQKGYEVKLVDVAEIGTTAAAIDKWIEDSYNEWDNPPEFMLFCGGSEEVPTLRTDSQRTECDNKLAVVGQGNVPSIHAGRLTYNKSIDNLKYQAWKILSYEKEPLEGDWLTKAATWGCRNPNGEPTATKWQKILEGVGYTVKKHLEASGAAKGAALIREFNDGGYGTFGYKGHGAIGTLHSASIDVRTLQQNIANGKKWTWFNNIGCNTSEFSKNYSISEAWMSEGSIDDPKGTVGMFAYTVSSSVGGSDGMLSNIFESLWGSDKALWHVGAAADYSKSKCSNTSDVQGGMIWGCPEIFVTNVSAPPQLTAKIESTNRGITVMVTSAKGAVEGAMVGLVEEGTNKAIGGGYTDASGKVTIDGTATGKMILTASAKNHKPFNGPVGTAINTQTVALNNTFAINTQKGMTVSFSMNQSAPVDFKLYSLTGKELVHINRGMMKQGAHTLAVGSKSFKTLPAGMYIAKLTVGTQNIKKSFSLVK